MKVLRRTKCVRCQNETDWIVRSKNVNSDLSNYDVCGIMNNVDHFEALSCDGCARLSIQEFIEFVFEVENE